MALRDMSGSDPDMAGTDMALSAGIERGRRRFG
jgi:hypothetical protein